MASMSSSKGSEAIQGYLYIYLLERFEVAEHFHLFFICVMLWGQSNIKSFGWLTKHRRCLVSLEIN